MHLEIKNCILYSLHNGESRKGSVPLMRSFVTEIASFVYGEPCLPIMMVLRWGLKLPFRFAMLGVCCIWRSRMRRVGIDSIRTQRGAPPRSTMHNLRIIRHGRISYAIFPSHHVSSPLHSRRVSRSTACHPHPQIPSRRCSPKTCGTINVADWMSRMYDVWGLDPPKMDEGLVRWKHKETRKYQGMLIYWLVVVLYNQIGLQLV